MMRLDPNDQDCSGWNWFSDWTMPGACEQPDSVFEAVTGAVGESWVTDIKNGVSDVVKTMVTFWIDIPDPNIGTLEGAKSEVVSFLQDRFVWLTAIIMCFSILFQIIRCLFELSIKPAKQVAAMIGLYLGTLALSIPFIVVGLQISNALAQWILLDSTVGTSFGDNLFSLFNNAAGITGTVILCILLIVAALLAGLQCLIMISRNALLYVMVGSLPLIAGTTASETGKESFKKIVSWIIALIAYKVVAAMIYGTGFRFLGTDVSAQDNGLLQLLYGLALLFLGVLALPATMRLIAPVVAPASSGNGAGSSIATAATLTAGSAMRAVR